MNEGDFIVDTKQSIIKIGIVGHNLNSLCHVYPYLEWIFISHNSLYRMIYDVCINRVPFMLDYFVFRDHVQVNINDVKKKRRMNRVNKVSLMNSIRLQTIFFYYEMSNEQIVQLQKIVIDLSFKFPFQFIFSI